MDCLHVVMSSKETVMTAADLNLEHAGNADEGAVDPATGLKNLEVVVVVMDFDSELTGLEGVQVDLDNMEGTD